MNAQLGLGGGRMLDDGLEPPVGAADDAAVAGRVGDRRRGEGDGCVVLSVVGHERPNRPGTDKRAVAGEHEHVAVEALQRLPGARRRVAGAELLLLRDVDEVAVVAMEDFAHPLGAVSDHKHDRPGTDVADRIDDPADHRVARDLTGDLG